MATLNDLSVNYLTTYAKSVNLKGIKTAETNISTLLEYFGKDTSIFDLKVKHIMDFVNHRYESGVGKGTIRRELGVFQSMVNQGIRFEVIENYDDDGDYSKDYVLAKRLAKSIGNCKPKQEKRKVRPSLDDFHKAAKFMPEWLFRLSYAAVLTGWRKEELLNLKFKDVNLKDCELYLSDSKNGESRITPLFPELCEFFKLIWEEANSNFNYDDLDQVRVFRDSYGRPINYWRLYNPFRKAMVEAGLIDGKGIAKYHFHDLRKLAVRYLVEIKKFPKDMIKDCFTGHKSDDVFEQVYNIRGTDTYNYYKKMALKS